MRSESRSNALTYQSGHSEPSVCKTANDVLLFLHVIHMYVCACIILMKVLMVIIHVPSQPSKHKQEREKEKAYIYGFWSSGGLGL